PPIVHDVLRSPGRPLDPGTRTQMEARLGHDFGAVRVHTDSRAGRSADAVQALAYTVGSHVAFAPGRYAPGSPQGRRLLAHELTHVVQQRSEMASASAESALEVRARAAEAAIARPEGQLEEARQTQPSAGTLRLQRQAAPAAPPPPAGWTACAADEITSLNRELAEAVTWVSEAITDLQAPERPARTTGALGRYLSTEPAHVTNTILPRLRAILADLQLGTTNFRCQTEQQCRAAFPSGANAYSGNPVTLCPGYFRKGHLGRVTTLVHESGHNAGLRGNVVEWQWPFPGLSVSTRLGNTESYAAFVRSNQYPALAPYQEEAGLGLRVGGLFPGGAQPRVVVTAEFDPLLAQRIFRFVDLRVGLRVDVDARGSILAQGELGTRLFAPVSVSATPLFLDLRTGLVAGRVADVGDRFERVKGFDLNVVGASAEARIGFTSGRLGGSVGYRHIWDLMQRNPDISQVTIGGEVRF
ncbi:MAG TPA: DUF4157 domain-containing protein, partial [Actinomycetota bacterium]|nr:DUF4157 domain-containing protein [Actinomycetota bacterium]